jgi:methionine-S-sulfoxide reductase
VGYHGGDAEWPTYRSIKDHTETYQVIFDPAVISYDTLLEKFWSTHDPTRRSSTQYMSGCWYQSGTDQQARIQASIAKMEANGDLGNRALATKIGPLGRMYLGEGYHQKYLERDLLDDDEWLKTQVYG